MQITLQHESMLKVQKCFEVQNMLKVNIMCSIWRIQAPKMSKYLSEPLTKGPM